MKTKKIEERNVFSVFVKLGTEWVSHPPRTLLIKSNSRAVSEAAKKAEEFMSKDAGNFPNPQIETIQFLGRIDA